MNSPFAPWFGAPPLPSYQPPPAANTDPMSLGSGMSASDTFANLTRSQWANYITQWVPYENKFIDYATDPTVVSKAMQDASQNVTGAFDRQGAATEERLRGLGLTLNADEQHASNRSLGIAKSLADVNAQNTARDQKLARQQSILGNPTPVIGG